MSLLPEHSHCQYCDEPVDEGQEFCSDECRENFRAEARTERNRNMMFYLLAAIALTVVTLLVMFG